MQPLEPAFDSELPDVLLRREQRGHQLDRERADEPRQQELDAVARRVGQGRRTEHAADTDRLAQRELPLRQLV